MVAVVAASSAAAERPAVEWAQYPVRGGDNVLLQGGNWGKDAVVEMGGQKIKPVFTTDTGLVFPYPAQAAKILTGRVVSENGSSDTFTLNAPDVWWLQGDGGDVATPGGWLRVFGRALKGGEIKVKSKSEKVKSAEGIELPLTRVDDYELAAKVPSDLACGEYEVFVRSAISEWTKAGTWTVAPPRKIWKGDVFDIADFGAVPDDGLDDSDAFAAALAAAGRNGGGVVSVPRGCFNVKGTFEIPTNTLIRGVSKSLSHLKWPDLLDPPEYMLIGDHSFGIHDLFISVGQYRNGLTYKGNTSKSFWAANEPKTHDISLRNLTLRFVTDQQRDRDKKVFMERFTMKGMPINLPDALRVEMVNVDLYCDKCPTDSKYFTLTGWYHRIANCSFRGGAWAATPGVSFIFEDNEISSGCMSINPMCQGAYFARNRFRDVYRGDPVCFGHDSSRTAFGRGCEQIRGEVEKTGGDRDGCMIKLTFTNPADSPVEKAKAKKVKLTPCEMKATWIGTSLTIFRGRGAGQSRTITSISDDWTRIGIDRPFGVSPDETSWMYVSYERKHVLMIDNTFTDVGTAVELYGGANEYIIARNESRRGGGFKAFGFEYSGVIPCWRIQFLDNVISEGSGERRDSDISAIVEDWPYHTRGCVARGNRIDSNGVIDFFCEDGLVEGNFIRNSRYGIKSVAGNYIGSNRFENVEFPLRLARRGTLGDLARRQNDAWQRELGARLKALPSPVMTPVEFKRTFAAVSTFDPDRATLARALDGDSAAFDLPYVLFYDSLLTDVVSCEVTPADSNGWRYGGSQKLTKRQDGAFVGAFRVTPSGERTGYFTVPLKIRLTGRDGWTVETTDETLIAPPAEPDYWKRGVIYTRETVTAPPLAQNIIRSWRYVQIPTNEIPKDTSKLDWKPVTKFQENGGVDCRDLDCLPDSYRNGLKESLLFETKIDVKRPVTIGFLRDDIPGQVFLDGKMILRAGSWMNTVSTQRLEPGVHILREFRPCGGWMMRYRAKSMRFMILHPEGARPGDYEFK